MLKIPKTKLNVISSYKLFCIVLLLAIAFSVNSCYSPQEKTGFSSMPQNKPSKWENKFNNNAYGQR